jgi:DNA-binding transcriptional LysR family regulator
MGLPKFGGYCRRLHLGIAIIGRMEASLLDRIDSLRAFLATVDAGSLAAAGRRLGRSATAMTRTLAALEEELGAPLFERSTRLVRLTEAGERCVEVGRRIIADFEAIQSHNQSALAPPRGLLTLTAPLTAGLRFFRPILDDFLRDNREVTARLLLFDRPANMVEEGFDMALRIAHLPDSTLVAMRVGDVRRVICASPRYLDGAPKIEKPDDLAAHPILTVVDGPQTDNWTFSTPGTSTGVRTMRLSPRLVTNSIEATMQSAAAGLGVARLFSYQVADEVRRGRLQVLLDAFEPPPLPVHLIAPRDRLATPKTRVFADFAKPRLRQAFEAAALP